MINSKALLGAAILMVSGLFCTIADAQRSFENAFGNGVHHYFNQEYQEASDSMSAAIAENGQDARAYYFRGLANEKMGKDGSADYEMGARLEASQGGRLSIVNDSLERIQGSTRITIENLRHDAVMIAKRTNNNQPFVARTFPVQNSGTAVEMPAVVKSPSPDDVASNQEVKQASNVVPSPDESGEATAQAGVTKAAPLGVEEKVQATEVDLPFGNSADSGEADAEAGISPFGGQAESEKKMPTDDLSPFGESAESVEGNSPFGEAVAEEKVPSTSEISPFGNEAEMEEKETGDAPSPFGDVEVADTAEKAVDDVSPFGEAADKEATNAPEAAGTPVVEEKNGKAAPDDPFDI